jgi:hypothetical protein
MKKKEHNPIVMDNKFFVISLIYIGMLALIGAIFVPIMLIITYICLWIKRLGRRKK